MKYYFRKEPMDMTGCIKEFIDDVRYHAAMGDELTIHGNNDYVRIRLKSGKNFKHSNNDYWHHNNDDLPIVIGIREVELPKELFEI